MRAHGIAASAATTKTAPCPAVKTDRGDYAEKATKKRKNETYIDDNGATDDDEFFPNHIKPDPIILKEEKYKFKEEEHDPAHQLSTHKANQLMHYYDSRSPYDGGLGDERRYLPNDLGGSAGYQNPVGASYGLQAQPYVFGNGLGSASINGVLQTDDRGLNYQSMIQFPSDSQGRPDSPVIVE